MYLLIWYPINSYKLFVKNQNIRMDVVNDLLNLIQFARLTIIVWIFIWNRKKQGYKKY